LLFLVDAQLPPALAAWPRAKGHDALAVRDIGMRDAPDAAIWARATALGAVVVTQDEDFVYLSGMNGSGPPILWLRVGNMINRILFYHFERMWPQIEHHIHNAERIVELY